MNRMKAVIICFSVCLLMSLSVSAQDFAPADKQAQEAFAKPNLHSPKELYRMAREAMGSGRLNEARLFALRLFFDGNRSQNLLNLLGVVELQAGQPLIASEWLRRANAMTLNNKVAQRYLSRLPAKPRPIPVDQTKLADHFGEISNALPPLLARLANPKLHFGAIMKAIERGQVYLALALSEEYEKKYPGPDGPSLTALCAWYLGRNRDALNIVRQNLTKYPFHPVLLFVKAMIEDGHPASSSGSYFRALYDLDQWDKALELVDRFSAANPNSPDAYLIQARILLDMNKVKEAGQALQEAGKRDPGNPEIDLLWVGYLMQRNEADKASTRLSRAFRRGYNMPSVSLAAGLFAIQGGRINEVNVILNDAVSSRPFNDPEAYPTYVSLLLLVDRIPDARNALDEWKARSPEKSMYCYLEAFYSFKTGENAKGLEWLRKAFEMNPDRLSMLQFMAGFPALADDPNLFAQINNRLARSMKEFSEMPVPQQKPITISAQPSSPTDQGGDGMFQITLGPGIDPSGRKVLGEELNRMYARIAARIGNLTVPIFINFVSAEGLGPTIAMYDPHNNGIIITTVYYDGDMIRNIIRANFDAFGEEELGRLIDEFPGHVVAGEMTRLMIQILLPEAKTNKNNSAWMQYGLAEVLAASKISQRYRMLVAQKSIDAKVAKLSSAAMLNSIFAEGYTSPAVFETATAQAYLMVAFLLKRSGPLEKGCREMMKLIESVSKGATLDAALKEAFNISEEEFDKGWREAAYWALQQGAPYEW